MAIAPEPYLAACLRVLYAATLEARLIGYAGAKHGLSAEDSRASPISQTPFTTCPTCCAAGRMSTSRSCAGCSLTSTRSGATSRRAAYSSCMRTPWVRSNPPLQTDGRVGCLAPSHAHR